jgi:hypothetical protein
VIVETRLEQNMGVDLYVLSPQETILTSEELRRELRSHGWEVRFVIDQAKPVLEPAAEGPLTDLLDVMGWPTSSDKGVLVAEAIERRDLNTLQSLYDEGVVGTCGYGVERHYVYEEELEDEFEEEEFEDEEQEPIDASCLEAMKRAKTKYGLRVRIRSSNQSNKFLNVVWEAIGRLRDGLLVDPQSGEFRHAK